MTYSDLRAKARYNLAGNWGISVGIAVVAFLLGGLLAGGSFLPEVNLNGSEDKWNQIRISSNLVFTLEPLALVTLLVGGPVQLGYARFLLNQHDRQPIQFSDLFSQFDRFGQGFAQSFLRGLYVFLWSLLFIIPGIVKTYAYAMTPYIMADHPELTANEAITRSRELMDGHKGELFTLHLTFIGWSILAALSLNIGNLWLNPYRNAAEAAFYRELCPAPVAVESSGT